MKKEILEKGVSVTDLCADLTSVFASKGELRRMVQGGGFSINKTRIDSPDMTINHEMLLNARYLLLQKGKKNYSLIKAV